MSTRKPFQVVCVALVLAFVAGSVTADPFMGVIENLTNDDVDSLNLVVSGDNAAWQSPDPNSTDPSIDPISTDPNSTDPNSTDPNSTSEIFLYLGDSGEVLQLTLNHIDDIEPVISGSYVAWVGMDANDWEIFVYNGYSVIQITDNDYDDLNPKLSPPFLFWEGLDDQGGSDWEVYKTTIPVPRPPIEASHRITPRTLNQKSKGKWISCVLYLPEGTLVTDVDTTTILLEGQVSPDQIKLERKKSRIYMKFLREEVIEVLEAGNAVDVEVTAYLTDGTKIAATDTIRVIH